MSTGKLFKIHDPHIQAEIEALWKALEARTTTRAMHDTSGSGLVGLQALFDKIQELEARITTLESAP